MSRKCILTIDGYLIPRNIAKGPHISDYDSMYPQKETRIVFISEKNTTLENIIYNGLQYTLFNFMSQ